MKRTRMLTGATRALRALRYANTHGLLELLEEGRTFRPSDVRQELKVTMQEASKMLVMLHRVKIVDRRKASDKEIYYHLNKRHMGNVYRALMVLGCERV